MGVLLIFGDDHDEVDTAHDALHAAFRDLLEWNQAEGLDDLLGEKIS